LKPRFAGKGGIDFVFKLLLSAIVVSKLRFDKLFEELSLGTAFKENTFQSSGLATIVLYNIQHFRHLVERLVIYYYSELSYLTLREFTYMSL
jgi:hypothetical protein